MQHNLEFLFKRPRQLMPKKYSKVNFPCEYKIDEKKISYPVKKQVMFVCF